MLAYPTEYEKGKFIGIFWSIFNLGGVVGAAVSLGQNFHSEVSGVHRRLCDPCRVFHMMLTENLSANLG